MTQKENLSMNRRDKILAECIGEEPPPCQAACPLDIRVRDQMRFLKEGRTAEALAVVLERCPFPGILGRICARPCEAACTRGSLGGAIAIAGLKRYLSDLDREAGPQVTPGPEKPEAVAVVGGGPAGLMAAYELRLKGYRVTLFEAEAHLGGALRLYVPAYRLPREVLDRETGLLQKLGVEVRLRTRLGRDVQLEDLRRDFGAVFLAVGCHKSLLLEAAGEQLAGVWYGLDFLKTANSGTPPEVGPRVAVIGGGDTALDAARTARRLGAREVHILYRRTAALMPAMASEVAAAQREGVQFHFLTLPFRILGDGRVRGLLSRQTELGEPDAQGRPRAVPVAGSEHTLEVDTVIIAVGQTADFRFFGPGLGFDTSSKAKLDADPVCLATPIPGVFAGGDLATGPDTAVAAFAAGRRAALAIEAYLQGRELPEILPPLTSRTTGLVVNTTGISPVPRQEMPELDPQERLARAFGGGGAGFQPGRGPTGGGTVPRLHLLAMRRQLHLSKALCANLPPLGKGPGAASGGSGGGRTGHSLFLPYLRPLPGGLSPGIGPRPGLPGGPGAPGGPRQGAAGAAPGRAKLRAPGDSPRLYPEPAGPGHRQGPPGLLPGLFPAGPQPPPGQGGLCLSAGAAPRYRHPAQLLRRAQPVAGGTAGAGTGGRRGGS